MSLVIEARKTVRLTVRSIIRAFQPADDSGAGGGRTLVGLIDGSLVLGNERNGRPTSWLTQPVKSFCRRRADHDEAVPKLQLCMIDAPAPASDDQVRGQAKDSQQPIDSCLTIPVL
jgi:hypothetical protein